MPEIILYCEAGKTPLVFCNGTSLKGGDLNNSKVVRPLRDFQRRFDPKYLVRDFEEHTENF